MTALQAFIGQVAQRATKARDYGRIWAIARDALGIVVLAAMLVAGLALRALVYIRLP